MTLNINKIQNILKLFYAVFFDSVTYFTPVFIYSISKIMTSFDFANFWKPQLPEMLYRYIIVNDVHNTLSFLPTVFLFTFLGVFLKHTKGITADYSNEIWRKIIHDKPGIFNTKPDIRREN